MNMKKTHIKQFIFSISFFGLSFATVSATITSGSETFASLVNAFTNGVISALSGLFLALGVIAFLYGVVEYIWARRKGDEKALADGNKFMVWGLVALFVMFSVYGIINLAQSILFQGKDVGTISIPNIQLK